MRFLSTLAILAIIIGNATVATAQRLSSEMQKLLNAEYAIKTFYVDTLSESKLVEDAIVGMLEKLDPHSSYTNASETRELEEPLQGEFSGIGIQFNMKEDTLYVIQTIAGGPSERVGLLPGDRIISVNDTTIAGVKMSRTSIMKRLRGKKGTKVSILVKRGNEPKPIAFTITRDKIPLYSVDAAYMLDDKTAYIRISSFGLKTHEEMMDALKKLKGQGMEQVIIDLSDNGGGYLNAAIDMSNEFLERGRLIVYTQGETVPRNEARAIGNGKYAELPMVIIVNQYSASAAEIFAGAMQDWDRAVVVGRRTFAKGLVQRPFHFEDGSMMRLTVARYYTPSGRCIQKPYKKGDKKAYEQDLVDRYNDGEYYNIDSIHIDRSQKYSTLTHHRTIYGGGGILPDVFIPVDTSRYSTYYRDMTAKGVINKFSIDYVDRHRKDIKEKYPTLDQFDKGFELDDTEMKRFVTMGEEEKVTFNEQQYETSKSVFRLVIKALIARDVYQEQEAYTVVVNHDNPDLKEALDVINNSKRYNKLLRETNPAYEEKK